MIDSLVIHTPKEKKMKKAKEMENKVRERERERVLQEAGRFHAQF